MGNSNREPGLDEYITASDIQNALAVSKTESYDIIKEIEAQDRTKGAVFRYERTVRVKRSAFMDWVENHSEPRDRGNSTTLFIPNLYRVA